MAFVPSSSLPSFHLRPPLASPSTSCGRRPRCRPVCAAQKPQTSPAPSVSPTPTNITENKSKQRGPHYDTSRRYLLSLGLSVEDAGRALGRLPTLSQTADLSRVAAPMINYLRSDLRMSRKQVAQAVRFAPQMLLRQGSEAMDFTTRLDFLEGVARISSSQLPATIAKCPHILWMNVEEAEKVVRTIIDACPLISPSALGVILAKVPQALVTPHANISDNLRQIRNIGGVCDPSSMARIIVKLPLSLIYSADNTIHAKIKYLSTELGLPIAIVGKVLIAIPQVLQWSIDKVLKPRIMLLKSIIGSVNYEDLISIIDKVPMILAFDDILDRVVWLRETVGLSDEQIRLVVIEAPAVLTYSVVGNLAPKWAFISETMGGSQEDIVAVPREALCANLQQRAMPRYAFLASMGRHNQVAVIDMLKGSDLEFCKHVAHCDPAHFREYVDNDTYLLFFSQLI